MPRGDATREKLLHSAVQLFHEFGYNGTSVRDIVSEAGVPKRILPLLPRMSSIRFFFPT